VYAPESDFCFVTGVIVSINGHEVPAWDDEQHASESPVGARLHPWCERACPDLWWARSKVVWRGA
jgi:hypothetical protein